MRQVVPPAARGGSARSALVPTVGAPAAARYLGPVLIGLACCVLIAMAQATTVHLFRNTPAPVLLPWLVTFSLTLPSWLIIGAAAPLVIAAARRFSFEPGHRAASVAVHAALGLTCGLAHVLVMTTVYYFFWTGSGGGTARTFSGYFATAFRYQFLFDVLMYWAIVGGYLVVHFATLKRTLAEARLAALRAQLNPHFLFNTLNAISTLALRGDRDAVTESVARLSDLLRAALDDGPGEVSLSRELEFTESYIALQKLRFGNRLQFDFTVHRNALAAQVPSMTLQPLVENAVVHGIPRGDALSIHLHAERAGDMVVIEISDNGPGFPAAGALEGTGLSATRERLVQMYGRAHRLEFGASASGGASVRLALPFRPAAI